MNCGEGAQSVARGVIGLVKSEPCAVCVMVALRYALASPSRLEQLTRWPLAPCGPPFRDPDPATAAWMASQAPLPRSNL